MDKVYIVMIRDWCATRRFLPFSYHRTEAGAKANVKKACAAFDTNDFYIDDPDVQE